jgi:hypothetical protein
MEDLYSGSLFWLAMAIVVDIARFILPLVFFVGCGLWAWRTRAMWAYVAGLGATVTTIGYFTRLIGPSVRFTSLSYGLQPLVEQNSVIFFFHMYALDLGYFLIAIGLIGFFLRKRQSA